MGAVMRHPNVVRSKTVQTTGKECIYMSKWQKRILSIVLTFGMAASLARGLTQEELSRLAAFFTVLGDLLALYALDAPEGRQNAPPTGP